VGVDLDEGHQHCQKLQFGHENTNTNIPLCFKFTLHEWNGEDRGRDSSGSRGLRRISKDGLTRSTQSSTSENTLSL